MATISIDCDCFLNIVKRKDAILYRTSVASNSAGVSFLSGIEVESGTCLSIADRSTSLAANRATKSTPVTISGTKTFTIDTDNFVVTDVYTEETSTISPTPLFYKHILGINTLGREDLVLYTLLAGIKILDIQILDLAFQPVRVTEAYLDTATGIIYNNLDPYYTSSSLYNYYYVKYTVSVSGVVSTYTELLNNQATYRLATYSDLDGELAIIRDGRKVYLIDDTDTGFEVTLPVAGTYTFKAISTMRLQALPPTASTQQDPWYVRIANGKFYATIGADTYKYYVAEFDSQTFYPEPPYKKASAVIPELLSTTMLKVRHANLVESNAADLGTAIELSYSDGEAIAAFTTLDVLEGETAPNGKTYTKWSAINPVGIRSIDQLNGLIDIDGMTLSSDLVISVSYYYAESTYEVSLINFNPTSNRDVLTNRIAFFVDPDTNAITKDQTVFYIKIDPSGKIIESNWTSYDNETQTVNGEEVYFGDAPTWKPSGPTRTNFLTTYTTEGSGVLLVLAEIVVATGSSPEDVTVLDSRVRGGGIIVDKESDAIALAPELAWNWDVSKWDGMPYPGNATFLVEVPTDILEGDGGTFTQQELIDTVKRHTGLGIYPVIRTYSDEITVSGVAWHDPRSVLEWAGR